MKINYQAIKLGLLALLRKCKRYISNVMGTVNPRWLGFSQAGEDVILRFLFDDMNMNMANISYLDIGACHPFSGNNSYFLYHAGSKGVLVEPTKNYLNDFKKIRSRDVFLNMCVTPDENKNFVNLYYSGGGSGSTIDKLEAQSRDAQGMAIERVDEVPATTITKIIEKYFDKYPDFLCIDIEGVDLAVLKTLDLEKYRIPVILLETCVFSTTHVRPKDITIFEYMEKNGYTVYADTYINTIFVNKEWFYKTKKNTNYS